MLQCLILQPRSVMIRLMTEVSSLKPLQIWSTIMGARMKIIWLRYFVWWISFLQINDLQTMGNSPFNWQSPDNSPKLQLTQVDLSWLWILAASQHRSLSKQALCCHSPTHFYLCKSKFSIIAVTNSKTRNKTGQIWRQLWMPASHPSHHKLISLSLRLYD